MAEDCKEEKSMTPEEKFFRDLNSTENDLQKKFHKAAWYSSQERRYLLGSESIDQLQKIILVLEDGFKILVDDEDTFNNVFEYLKSHLKESRQYWSSLIDDLYQYLGDLTILLHKMGATEKAKLSFKKIAKFCLQAVSKHKTSATYYDIIKMTCHSLEKSMSTIKDLNMVNEILDEIATLMKACEKEKPRDFGHFRLLKGQIMKELGKTKKMLSEYEKAQDFFRRLIFNWIEKKGKKDVLWHIIDDYHRSEKLIFQFWNEKGEYLKAINVYDRYLKKN